MGMGGGGRRTARRGCRWTLAERKEPGQCQAEAEIRRDARKAAQAHGALGVASSSTGRKGSAMVAHKFKAGETVKIISSGYITNARGSFTIVCVLPEDHAIYHSPINSTVARHERVVMETEAA